jgi:hypothetical protein
MTYVQDCDLIAENGIVNEVGVLHDGQDANICNIGLTPNPTELFEQVNCFGDSASNAFCPLWADREQIVTDLS